MAEIEEKALISTLLMVKLTQWIGKNLTKLARAGLIEESKSFDNNGDKFRMLVSTLRS